MVMPVATLPPPGVSDLAFTFDTDTSGVLTVDMPLTPAGDLAFVAGPSRLAQDVLIWLLTPQGFDQTDPTFGNPLYGLIGRPGFADPIATIGAMVQQAEAAFLARQQQEVAAGQRTTDEQVRAFTNTQVVPLFPDSGIPAFLPSGGGTLPPIAFRISFDIVTMAGTLVPAQGTLPGSLFGISTPTF